MWIEIPIAIPNAVTLLSPPIRRCGLKLNLYIPCLGYLHVTSYTEVWIEITTRLSRDHSRQCHLLYGGVDWNFAWKPCSWWLLASPPIRRCGLKLVLNHIKEHIFMGHLLYGGVDWNTLKNFFSGHFVSHLLYGGVDWNYNEVKDKHSFEGHLLYGGVNWDNMY